MRRKGRRGERLDLFANVLVALGATKTLLAIQLVWLATLAPALVVGVRVAGLTGAAIAHVTVAGGVLLPLYAVVLRRVADVGPAALLHAVIRPVVAAAVAAGAASVVAGRPENPWLALVVGAVVGAGCYLACLGPWLSSLRAEVRALWSARATGVEAVRPPVVAVETG